MTQKPLFLFSNILGYLSLISALYFESAFMMVVVYLSAASGFLLGVLALSKEPYFNFAEDRFVLGGPAVGFFSALTASMGLGRLFCGWESDNFLFFALGNLILIGILTFIIVRSCWVPKHKNTQMPTQTPSIITKAPAKTWQCKCGRENSDNTLTCFCGVKKRDIEENK